MKQKRNKKKDILFILISSSIVVFAWIGFNIYHIWATTTVSKHIQYQLTPIDPTFNQAVIQQLKTRENINPQFQAQETASQPATALPPIQPTIFPSPTGAPAVSGAPSFAPTNVPIERQGQ